MRGAPRLPPRRARKPDGTELPPGAGGQPGLLTGGDALWPGFQATADELLYFDDHVDEE